MGDSISDVVIVDVTSVGIQGPPGPVGPIGPAGPTGTTGLTPIVATGSTTPRALQDRFAEVVNVKDFGAVGDGVTDDTVAINAALSYIRANKLITVAGSGFHSPFRLVFPPGRYLVTAPLNFTGFASIAGGVIDGQGSEIWATMPGGVVIDCSGSRWLRFRDLTVYGDPANPPGIGFQFSTVTTASADYHSLVSVNVWGNFGFSALYNLASENFVCLDCSFRNNALGINKFCAVLDGMNHWAAHSTFVTIANAVEAQIGFQQAVFISTAFQGWGSNGTIWMGQITRHAYKRCYASNQTTGSNIFTIYQPNIGPPAGSMLELDVHTETNAVTNMVVVTAPAGRTGAGIYALTITDNGAQATAAIFAIDPASSLTSVELRDATINVWSLNAMLVDTPAKWVIRAKTASLYDPAHFNTPSVWTGPTSFTTAPQLSYRTLDQWTTSARPSPPRGTIGFATDIARLDIYDGSAWSTYTKLGGDTMTGALIVPGLSVRNTTVNSYLNIGANAGQNRGVLFNTGTGGTAVRWLVGANSTGESGSNAGSDFMIERYDETTGLPIDATVLITRSTGQMTLAQSLRVNGLVGFNNTVPVGKPTGWGTSTGGARAAITAASTLPQLAAGLAQLLNDLTAYGLIGV